MRRHEIKLDQVYAQTVNAGHSTPAPIVPVAAVAELHLVDEYLSPAIHHLSSKTLSRPSFSRARMSNIGLRFNRMYLRNFEKWADLQDASHRPAVLDVAFETAARLREWFELIPAGEQLTVPDDMVPDALQLTGFRSQELIGEWLLRRGDQIAMHRQETERKRRIDEERRGQQEVFGAVADRVKALLDVDSRPGVDFYRETDYSQIQLPLKVLVTMLDELEEARG